MSETAAPEPLVSVIIPVYNAGKFLRETLDCLCNQTLREIEVICVDDGSTDDSPAILQEYADRDGRFRILQQKNQHAGVARNNGMAVAKGKYLSFLDADDLFEPEMLEKMSSRAEATKADIVCCLVDVFTADPAQCTPMRPKLYHPGLHQLQVFTPRSECGDKLFQSFQLAAWEKLYSSDFVKRNAITWNDSAYANDFPFVGESLYLAERCSFLDASFVHYRVHAASISHKKSRKVNIWFDSWRTLHNRLTGHRADEASIQSLCNAFVDTTCWFLSSISLESREEALNIYKKHYDETTLHLLEGLPAGYLKQPAANEFRAFFKPALTVIIPITSPEAGLNDCIMSLRALEAEVILDISHASGAAVEQARAAEDRFFWVRTGTEAASCARAHRVAIIHPNRLIACNNSRIEHALEGAGSEPVNLDRYSRRYVNHPLFYIRTYGKRSWRFLGIPLLTISRAETGAVVFILGKRIMQLQGRTNVKTTGNGGRIHQG